MIIRGDWVRLIRDVEGYHGVAGSGAVVQIEDPPDSTGKMSFVLHGSRYLCTSDDVVETGEFVKVQTVFFAEEF